MKKQQSAIDNPLLSHLNNQNLQFLQQLNRLRISMRTSLQSKDNNQEIQISAVLPSLLETQLLLYQNKYQMNIDQELEDNTCNILMAIKAEEYNCRIQEKSDYQGGSLCVDWGVMSQDNKNNISNTNSGKDVNNNEVNAIGTVALMTNIKRIQSNKQQNKKIIPEFVSASTLPSNVSKGTSLRKKFIPPFKKTDKQENQFQKEKAANKNSGDGEEQMDPRFKNLQTKLVQMIQSEILQRNSKVQWSEIAGLGFAKKIIHQMIVWPMLRPDIFTGLRAPPKSILFFGPPGTGKTMIGRAIASEANATFFSISASSLTSKWVGQSQKLVRTLFAVARLKQPSVIFIDEIDSLLCSRKQGEQESSRRVKTQFLVQLDGAKTNNQEKVLIIGATNLPQQLDDAVRRRFIKRLYIPLPNFQGRKQLLSTLTKNQSFALSEEDKVELSLATKGYSGSDLYNLCSQSALIPIRNLASIETIRESDVPVTKLSDFYEALKLVRPSVNDGLLQSFQQWNKSYGSYQLSPDELELAKKV